MSLLASGIGTDASIPAHINNICERNYARVGPGRRLIPTDLGIVLIHGYHKVRLLHLPRPDWWFSGARACVHVACMVTHQIPTSLTSSPHIQIDPDLARPTVRSAVEKELDMVAADASLYDAVVEHCLGVFQRKFEFFVSQVGDPIAAINSLTGLF